MNALESPQDQEKTFPLKGVYEGVKYRIDGDSVIVTASNGKELEFAPNRNVLSLPQDVIKESLDREVYDTNIFGLGAVFPAIPGTKPVRRYDHYGKFRHNWYSPGVEEQVDSERMWGISDKEYMKLWGTANSISKEYYGRR